MPAESRCTDLDFAIKIYNSMVKEKKDDYYGTYAHWMHSDIITEILWKAQELKTDFPQ